MSKQSTKIFIARHAECEMNLIYDEIIGGRSNESPLSELGEAQAAQLGRYILNHEINPDFYFASPAVRARDTIDIVLKTMGLSQPVTIDERLLEMSQGDAEGKPRKEIYTDAVLAAIRRQLLDFALPGGESMNEVGERVLEWLNEVAKLYPEKTILAGGHGLAIRCAAGMVLNWSHPEILAAQTPNASLSLFVVEKGVVRVMFVGKHSS